MTIARKSNNSVSGVLTPPKNEQLEAKMKLLALLPYDERARRKHCLVFGFVVDWYYDDYGNALAAALFVADQLEQRRHQIPNGKALCRSQVHSALTDLVRWNFLIEIKGIGRRASRYIPNWSLVWPPNPNQGSVPTCPDTNSVLSCPDDGVRYAGDTKGLCVRYAEAQDPFTRPGHRPGDGLNGNIPHAAPSAPPGSAACAPTGTDAARVPEGFDEFWSVFPKKVKRPRAEAAYAEATRHDAGLHALIVAKAKELADHHAKHGTEFKWIKEPANWLAGKGWTEDLPSVYGKPNGGNTTRQATKPTPTKPKPAAPANSNVPSKARQWQRVTIDGAEVKEHAKGSTLVLTLLPDGGEPMTESIAIEDTSQDVQEAGQKQFGLLRYAIGIGDIEDSGQLLGLSCERRMYNGKPEYQAIQASAA
jgi:hypothetical protein